MKKYVPTSLLTLGFTAFAPLVSTAALYTTGHGDLGIAYDAGAFDLHVHLHEFAVVDGVALAVDTEYTPGDLTIAVPGPSIGRPGSSTFNPIGIGAGVPMWFLPQNQDVNKPFFGIGAEELAPLDWTGNISLKLTGISGTGVTAGGNFSLWETDGFGDKTFRWTSADGLSGADILPVVPGNHAHYSWAFTKAGTYDLTFEATGTHAMDGLITDSATFSFDVAPVPEPGTVFTGLGCLVIAALRRSRARVRP